MTRAVLAGVLAAVLLAPAASGTARERGWGTILEQIATYFSSTPASEEPGQEDTGDILPELGVWIDPHG